MNQFLLSLSARAARYPKWCALLLGVVSAKGFAPLHLWPISLLAFAGWMWLSYQAPRARAVFALGWAFGLGHFALGLNWIATAFTYQAAMPAWLGWIAVVLLSLYLAIYPALAGLGAWLLGARQKSPAMPLAFLFAFASFWTISEWLRSWVFTGFAWNPLSAITVPAAAAPVRYIGTYGTSALVILAAALILLTAQRRFKPAAALAASLALIAALTTADLARDEAAASIAQKGKAAPLVTLVQPNIDQSEKWEGDHAALNFGKLARLTPPQQGVSSPPRLILWPEAAIPDYLERGYPSYIYDLPPTIARQRLTALMNPQDVMLLGALKLEFDDAGNAIGARNSVLSLYGDGTLGPSYDKAHLVPYGEYLPMRAVLSAIGLSRLAPGDLDFWAGPGPRSIDLAHFGRIGLQICYEIIFSGQVVDPALRPNFIFNPSNDAWFGAWGPPQHLAQARLRAIEEGLPVLRSTPTGISAIITPSGRITASIPMHTAGRLDAAIPVAYSPTFFAQHGNKAALGFALILLALAIAFRIKRR